MKRVANKKKEMDKFLKMLILESGGDIDAIVV